MSILDNRFVSWIFGRFLLRMPRLRTFVMRLVVPDQDVDINLFGADLRINRRKEFGYWRTYQAAQTNIVHRREAGCLMSLALLLGPEDTFVDVGANIGLYSALLSRMHHAYPKMKFYAFEPNSDTLVRLRQGLAGSPVTICPVALSDRAGELEFVGGAVSNVFGASKGATAFNDMSEKFMIKTCRLDEMDIEGDSLVLKIDVEGHERDVLEGATKLFAAGRVKAVYLDGYSDESIPEWLRLQGFSLFEGVTMKPALDEIPDFCLLALRILPEQAAHNNAPQLATEKSS